MSWHLEPEAVARYVGNEASSAEAASVEAHIVTCGDCRAAIATSFDAGRSQRNWDAIAAEVDQPPIGTVEKLLVRVGVRDHTARLLVTAPSTRVAWLLAVGIVMLLALIAGEQKFTTADRGLFFFLVAAPLLPLAGVATAFGRGTDPAYEITVAAPIGALELLVIRSASVLAITTFATAVAAVALPQNDWSAAAWLLPSLALTSATVAASRWIAIGRAAIAIGALWSAAAVGAAVNAAPAQLVDGFVALQPAGQVGLLVVTLAAIVLAGAQRSAYDLGRIN